jgi:hypothetical protein
MTVVHTCIVMLCEGALKCSELSIYNQTEKRWSPDHRKQVCCFWVFAQHQCTGALLHPCGARNWHMPAKTGSQSKERLPYSPPH